MNSRPGVASSSSGLSGFPSGISAGGPGILILAMLSAIGHGQDPRDEHAKALLPTISNGVAMLLFIGLHAVYWPETILMVVASMTGGYFGAHFAQKTKPEHVGAIIIVIGFTLTVYFFAKPYQR